MNLKLYLSVLFVASLSLGVTKASEEIDAFDAKLEFSQKLVSIEFYDIKDYKEKDKLRVSKKELECSRTQLKAFEKFRNNHKNDKSFGLLAMITYFKHKKSTSGGYTKSTFEDFGPLKNQSRVVVEFGVQEFLFSKCSYLTEVELEKSYQEYLKAKGPILTVDESERRLMKLYEEYQDSPKSLKMNRSE